MNRLVSQVEEAPVLVNFTMLSYRDSLNTKTHHLLGMRVGVCKPDELTVNGLLFVSDADNFIDKDKKCKEKLIVPNFNTDLFRQCVARLQTSLVINEG